MQRRLWELDREEAGSGIVLDRTSSLSPGINVRDPCGPGYPIGVSEVKQRRSGRKLCGNLGKCASPGKLPPDCHRRAPYTACWGGRSYCNKAFRRSWKVQL